MSAYDIDYRDARKALKTKRAKMHKADTKKDLRMIRDALRYRP